MPNPPLPHTHLTHPPNKLSETLKAMQEFIPLDRIPVEYGGQLTYSHEADSCRWNSPQEVALKEHVRAVNERLGVEAKWT